MSQITLDMPERSPERPLVALLVRFQGDVRLRSVRDTLGGVYQWHPIGFGGKWLILGDTLPGQPGKITLVYDGPAQEPKFAFSCLARPAAPQEQSK